MKTIGQIAIVAAALLILAAGCEAAEHAGKAAEQGGQQAEHGGQAAEHAGQQAQGFTAEQIKAAMNEHIRAEINRGGGVFKTRDPKTNEDLTLEFVKIHDPVRKIEGKGYFACTDFHPTGAEAGKLYDLDFWLNPRDGKLVVTETRIHKHPVRKGAAWEKEERYTFVNDNPVEVP